jgi:hypothetical protein
MPFQSSVPKGRLKVTQNASPGLSHANTEALGGRGI